MGVSGLRATDPEMQRHCTGRFAGCFERVQIKLWDGRLIRPSRSWADRATDVAVLAVDARDLTL